MKDGFMEGGLYDKRGASVVGRSVHVLQQSMGWGGFTVGMEVEVSGEWDKTVVEFIT